MGRAKALSLLLGPAGFGIVSTIDQVVMTVVQLGGLGMPFVALKILSFDHSESHQKFQVAYSSFLSGILGLSLCSTTLVLALVWLRPDLFGDDIVPYVEYLNLALLGSPALMMGIFHVNVLAAGQKPAQSATLNMIVTLCLSMAACLGVVLGGITGLYLASITTGVFTTLASLIYVGKILGLKAISSSAGIWKQVREKPEIISIASVLYIAMSAYSFSMLVVRYLVFSDYGEAQAGFFQSLLSIALALGAVFGPMNTLFLTPLLNRAIPAKEKFTAAHDFQKNNALALALFTLPVVLFPNLGLLILYSSDFTIVSHVLYLFVLWQCLYQIANVYQQLLIGLDDIMFYTISTTVGYVVAIACSEFLISEWALVGAVLVLIVSNVITLTMTCFRLKYKYASQIPTAVWLRMLMCFTGILVTGALFNNIQEWSLLGIGARFGFALVYIGVLWLLISPEQKQFILRLRSRLPFKSD